MSEINDQYKDLAELYPDAFIIQVDGQIVYCNQNARTLFRETTTARLVGMNAIMIVHPDFREFVMTRRQGVLASGSPAPYTETRHLRLDGTSFPSEMTVGQVRWDDRDGTMNIIHDVSKRRAAEEALRKSEAMLRHTQKIARIGTWEWDELEERTTWATEEAIRIFGREDDPDTSWIDDHYDRIHPEDREHYERLYKRTHEEPQPYKTQYRLVHPNGDVLHVEEIAEPVLSETGEVIAYRGTIQDISERIKIEEQLKQAQKMEVLGQLTGGVAHDFNNILYTIMGNAELLTAEAVEQDPRMQSIIRATERGGELTHRLLAYARKQTLKPQRLDLTSLIDDCRSLLDRTLGSGIEVDLTAPVENVTCYADPVQLESAILNLALNSRDAMPNGGVLSLALSNDPEMDSAYEETQIRDATKLVRLSVSDTGKGMSADELARACEPFFTTKDVGKGTGLGLSMVYGFAEQSGGHLVLNSTEGVGTKADLYLPQSAPLP